MAVPAPATVGVARPGSRSPWVRAQRVVWPARAALVLILAGTLLSETGARWRRPLGVLQP